ncbi:MAG: MASE1 domain-containing protein [Candidatus Omnitrophica bacterium]|nr:MASE1 domain-containing protein [Candidatus Omnitrophota bacterium]
MIRRFFTHLAIILVLATVYFFAGKFGLSLAFVHKSSSAVWPPTGIALAAVFLLGYRVWPGIFVGAFLVNLFTEGTILTSLGIATGNTLEAVAAVFLIQYFIKSRHLFERARHVFQYVVLACWVSPVISATFGVTTLSLAGFAKWPYYGLIWSTWWLGDMVSALIIAPFLIIWIQKPLLFLKLRRWLEGIFLLLLVFAVSQFVFGEKLFFETNSYPLEYLCIPVLLYAIFRFGLHGAVSSAFLISLIAIYGTLRGYGPFAVTDPNLSLLLLQAFMGTITLTALVLSAVLSEQKRIEHILRKREGIEKFRAVTETANDAIVCADHHGNITYFNKAAKEIFGYASDEITGQPLTMIMPERFREAHRRGLARFLRTQQSHIIGNTVELVGKKRNGVEFPLELSLASWKSKGEIFFVAIIRDITTRRQSEKALQESEERSRLLVSHVKDYAIFMLDPKGNVSSWNQGAERIKGYKAIEIVGRHFSAFYPEEDQKRGKPAKELEIAVRQGVVRDQGIRIRKDGTPFFADVVITALRDENKNLRGFGEVTRDITEIKKAEEMMKHKNLLMLLLQVIALAANQAQTVEEAMQICIDEICSHMGWAVGHAYKNMPGQFEEVVSTGLWYSGMPARFQAFCRATKNTNFNLSKDFLGTVLVTKKPIWIKDIASEPQFQRKGLARELGLRTAFIFPILIGNDVAGVLEFFSEKNLEPDEGLLAITPQIGVQIGYVLERQRAREALKNAYSELEVRVADRTKELKKANETLKQLDRMKSDFILTASHELRTPLTSIKGYISLILGEKAGEINDSQREFLNHVKNATDRLSRLLSELLNIAKIESGEIPMKREKTEIADLLRQEVDIFKGEAAQKNISLDLRLENKTEVIECDQDKIREVFANLINNALKYTPRNGKVRISVRREELNMVIEVKDTGIGIKLEDQAKIFQPFHHVRQTGLEGEDSTGLGLALTKKIVEAHQGKIEVESHEGEGSIFTVILPIRSASKN